MLAPAEPIDGEALLPLAEVKAFCRIDSDDEDALLAGLVLAATDWVERYSQRSLQRRRWRWSAAGFAPVMRLPIGPVDDDAAVVSIAYRDAAGGEAVLGAGAWAVSAGALIAAPGTAWPRAWGTDGSVTIEYEAGFGDVAVEAAALRTAVLFQVRHLYERANGEAPGTVLSLCHPYRVPVIG